MTESHTPTAGSRLRCESCRAELIVTDGGSGADLSCCGSALTTLHVGGAPAAG